jgi:hypothetical protein
MSDDRMRRYFVPGFFGLWDARVHHLEMPKDHWEEQVKALHIENRTKIIEGLKAEFGSEQFEAKLKNFQDIVDATMSIVSYHNLFFRQARQAFVIGSYYPALTSACALGERILNHLIIDLRGHFRAHPAYKEVYRKGSIDDWDRAVSVLEDWHVLEPNVGDNFKKLKALRHKSIHFDPQTYSLAREDALSALEILRDIIRIQFGAFGTQRWFIAGTKGACFIRKQSEGDPFVKTFYLKQCPEVGYRYALTFLQGGGVLVFDQDDYGNKTVSDEEFRDLLNQLTPSDLVPTTLPPEDGIITWLLVTGEASRIVLERAPQS